jgi:prepilin-type N-terminal cleavage/methylation domain-containing protein
MIRRQLGFTLIEIAIVMTIVGMILAGVLKGQALIQNSRVHSIVQEQAQTLAAFHAFQDRYRALPGDYASASTNISCNPACANGNGNGQIESTNHENTLVWSHLSSAGFITGSYSYDGTSSIDETNTPKNPYGAFLSIGYDNVYGGGTAAVRHNIKLGNMIPSDVLIEVDRKIDDGNPLGGTFQFSIYTGSDIAPNPAECITGTTWNIAGATNCGAAWLM